MEEHIFKNTTRFLNKIMENSTGQITQFFRWTILLKKIGEEEEILSLKIY